MQHHTHDDGVKLLFGADFTDSMLSKREIEALRIILPQLMIELVQSMPDSDDEE